MKTFEANGVTSLDSFVEYFLFTTFDRNENRHKTRFAIFLSFRETLVPFFAKKDKNLKPASRTKMQFPVVMKNNFAII